VSILEVPIAYAMHKWNWSRNKAVVIISAACFVAGVPAALSVGGVLSPVKLGTRGIFDLMDFATSYVLMPISGLVVTLFTGYAWKRAGEEAQLSGFWYKAWMVLLCAVSPILIVLVFLYSVGLISV
jgi:NSS family neurotransmitter:Na+ symporter